ncbi:MAG TPA: hypothetical protein VLS25_12775, partial [Dehalococcoidia bacterium]|nr:hypothetical protein [Dehalococcoidia bacterium]
MRGFRTGCRKGIITPAIAGALALALATVVVTGGLLARQLTARAAAGDFKLDFVAAAYQGTHTTYHPRGPSEGDQIGPNEPDNLAFDDRTINDDVVEQLEAQDFQCNDRIIFFTQIAVDANATDTNQTIFLEYDFDAVNNGQQGVGYSDILAVGISQVNFPPPSQTSEAGNIGLDGNETATLVSQAFEPNGSVFGDTNNLAQHRVGLVKITGLDPGEHLIVRIDTRFSCFPGNPPVTGNLHAAIRGAWYDSNNDGQLQTGHTGDDAISVGQQDVPMIGLGNVATPTTTPSPTPSPTPTPTPT